MSYFILIVWYDDINKPKISKSDYKSLNKLIRHRLTMDGYKNNYDLNHIQIIKRK